MHACGDQSQQHVQLFQQHGLEGEWHGEGRGMRERGGA